MWIYIILIVAVLLTTFVIAIYYENSALTISDYEVCSKRLPKEADGTNFVLIADLHSNQFGQNNIDLIQKIDSLSPDFIIVAGDLFIGREYSFDVAYDLLQKLSKNYTIYYSYGNHEQKVEQYEKRLKSAQMDTKKSHRVDESKDLRVIKSFAEFKKKVRALVYMC